MKYTAELPESNLGDLTITDEKGELVGYLTGFDSVLIAIEFMGMINGSKPPITHFPKGELEAVADVENDDDHQHWFVTIYADEIRICAVEGMDWRDYYNINDALRFGKALVKQIQENLDPEPSTRDEFLQQLREAWDDVVHHRTHILHDFTNFFKDELGEE